MSQLEYIQVILEPFQAEQPLKSIAYLSSRAQCVGGGDVLLGRKGPDAGEVPTIHPKLNLVCHSSIH